MPPSTKPLQVYTPRNLSELLGLMKRHTNAQVYAGGTYLLSRRTNKNPGFDTNLVSISSIEELLRIHRTERYLEVGACASINAILDVGSNILPEILSQTLKSIGSHPVRNLATLGGNLCAPDRRLSAFPVLLLLDARVELRHAGGSRWIPVNRMIGPEGTLAFAPGEILTRIRIPFGDWNTHAYRDVSAGVRQSDWSISFCGIAEVSKDTLTDLRVAYGLMGKTVIRDREVEAELVSRKLPLASRDVDAAVESMEQVALNAPSPISAYRQTLIGRFLRWFLSLLDVE